MTPERYQRVKSIFFEAAGSRGEARLAVLDRACGPDTALRQEVEKLLAAQEPATSEFHGLVAPTDFASVERAIENMQKGTVASSAACSLQFSGTSQEMPSEVAGYQLDRVIGSGGMGTVYAAQQQKPRRTVALKVMRPGVASGTALRRFEFEAQVLARLRHPGIAQIYEAGTFQHHGAELPFFAMEYVPDALTLTEYAEQKKLTMRSRLELFGQICDAVNYGHQKGVIHRDLKPSNVLVDARGAIKVIDFGVARSIDSDLAAATLQTDAGQLIGTLQYMSPEQVSADPNDIDIRSDVYSLGVVLYQLLAGQLPYDLRNRSILEASRIVHEQAPRKLSESVETSTWSKGDRRDLEMILEKALAKEKERRYGSAADLGADIGRFLNHEPILARPPSRAYQIRKFARKNRGVVIAASLAVVALVAGSAVATWQAVRATNMRREAESKQQLAEGVNAFFSDQILNRADPYRTDPDHPVTLAEAVDLAATRVKSEFQDAPLIRAVIHEALGRSYKGMGKYDQAAGQFEEALELRRASLGQDAPEALDVAHLLATVYRLHGRFEQAEPLYVDTLEARRRTLGEEHELTYSSMAGLGALYTLQKRNEEAIPLLERALDGQRKTIGENDINTIQSMKILAGAYHDLKEVARAEAMFTRVLALLRETLGDEHPDTTGALQGLGQFHYIEGDYDKALALLTEAEQIELRVLGEDHPNHVRDLTEIAFTLEKKRDFAAALKLYDEAVRICQTSSRPGRGILANTMVKRAGCLVDLKRFEEAEAALNESYPIIVESFGPTHYRTERVIIYKRDLYKAWGKPDLARECEEKLAALRQNTP